MIQHNLNKIHNMQTKYIKFVLQGFGIILVVISQTIRTLDYQLVSTVIGVFSFLSGLLLTWLDRSLWKKPLFQKLMQKIPAFEDYWTPVICGRWKGTLTRDGKEHGFVLEITQSFTSVSCTAYSLHSSSSAFATELLYDKQNKLYKLAFCWHGKTTSAQEGTGDTNMFDGFTLLNIEIEESEPTRLTGEYFTNRQPKQTKGTLILYFEQENLIHTFSR